jgi:hypothetical protein
MDGFYELFSEYIEFLGILTEILDSMGFGDWSVWVLELNLDRGCWYAF